MTPIINQAKKERWKPQNAGKQMVIEILDKVTLPSGQQFWWTEMQSPSHWFHWKKLLTLKSLNKLQSVFNFLSKEENVILFFLWLLLALMLVAQLNPLHQAPNLPLMSVCLGLKQKSAFHLSVA